MKAYLITTGLLFGALVALHIWKITAEWSGRSSSIELVAQIGVGILLPGALCFWAWRLLRKSLDEGTHGSTQGSSKLS